MRQQCENDHGVITQHTMDLQGTFTSGEGENACRTVEKVKEGKGQELLPHLVFSQLHKTCWEIKRKASMERNMLF